MKDNLYVLLIEGEGVVLNPEEEKIAGSYDEISQLADKMRAQFPNLIYEMYKLGPVEGFPND